MSKAVIFDLGGVLFTDGTKQFIQYLQEQYGVSSGQASKVLNGELGSQYRTGKMTRGEFWQQAVQAWDIAADINELERRWITGYHLDEQVKRLILDLKKKYKVYYLSDNVKERIDYIDAKYHFIELFDGGVVSHEVGVRKPKVKIYQLAIELTGKEPNELVFIDDKESALEPARNMGLQTIHFTGAENLRKELRNLELL